MFKRSGLMNHDSDAMKSSEIAMESDEADPQKLDTNQDFDTTEREYSAPYPELLTGIPVFCDGGDASRRMFATLKVHHRYLHR